MRQESPQSMGSAHNHVETAEKKVAIVCDWLIGTGGAERVVYELHKMFREAPIYTSQYNPEPQAWHGQGWFVDADVRTGWLQKLPKSLRKFLPVLRAWYFGRLDLSDYQLVISSSGAEAKAVKTGPNSLHICYCHSPAHYYWIRYNEYLKNPGFGRLNWLARLGLRLLVGPLRSWDHRAAQAADLMIANSTHTQAMIKKFYSRDSTVIHPPVDIERFAVKVNEPRRGFVIAGRQVPYKRIDLAVEACSQLKLPLVVLGNGPEHRKLNKIAGRSVSFIRNPSDEQVAHYFQTSLAFISAGMEDFGIVAVEAMAAGTPVIAYQAGGALDYIEEGKTGLFFDKQTAKSLMEVLQKFNPEKFNSTDIINRAKQFSVDNFRRNMQQFIEDSSKGQN